jgi:hypothetical protein
MRRDRLGRLYDRLTPEERFRLDVEAMARGDEEESRKLTDTCPRRNYVMNDWGFVGRQQAARELAILAYADLAKCLDKLQMIGSFRAMMPRLLTAWENYTHTAYFDGHHAGSRHAWRLAGKGGEPPGWETDEEEAERNADRAAEAEIEKWSATVEEIVDRLSVVLDELEGELAAQGLVVWSAFAQFCDEEMGLKADKVLAALTSPYAERARDFEELAERLEVEPDAQSVEEYRTIMVEVWRKVLEKG